MPDQPTAPPTLHSPEVSAPADELGVLVNAIQDYGMFVLSPTGVIRSASRGAEVITGYTAAEMVGSDFSRFYPPEDVKAGKPQRELRSASSTGRIEDEGWRVRQNGTRFWGNTVITALIDEAGTLRGFAKVTRDLTERRAAEERLRQSEEMLRLLVTSVQDYAIFMLDPAGRIASWNEGAQRIKQYTRDEIIGKHFSTFYPPIDIADRKPERELEQAVRAGRVEDEGWRIRKDGSRFWANVVITAVHDETGVLRGFAKVTRDITERREAEMTRNALLAQREARLHAEEEKRSAEAGYHAAQEANRAKDNFLMTLSHELRTPMTAILGWARMLPTMSPSEPMFAEGISAIARSARLQAKLIDDVLDVSRIVSGKLHLALESCEVAPVLQGALAAVQPSAQAKSIRITKSIAPNIGSATFDPTRLQQIIWNLLSNAVKFTPKDGHIELAARRTGSDLRISVADTGEGLDPQFLPHVFEPFRQAETPSTRVHGGLGLGLSIVRYLVEAHGGQVFAESEGRGKGTKFEVTIPILFASRTEEQNAPAGEEAPNPVGKQLSGRYILLVDDDDEGREMIAAALRLAGAEVTAVDSGRAALELVGRRRPDIVLTDIAMPAMDGYALRRELRERKELSGMRIVALSAFPASTRDGTGQDFDRFLRKPIDPFELTDRLAELLAPV